MPETLLRSSFSTLFDRYPPKQYLPLSPLATAQAKPLDHLPSQPTIVVSDPALVPAYSSPKSMTPPGIIPSNSTEHQSNEAPQISPSKNLPPVPQGRESLLGSEERSHLPPFQKNLTSLGPMTTSSILRTPSESRTSPLLPLGGRGKDDQVDRDELTTKGRKRKRLAKACSACHKNKRRCDGFAPCSNCEFSNRTCQYINAQGQPIPPPRKRESSANPTRNKDDDDKLVEYEASPESGHDRKGSGDSDWSRRDGQVDSEKEIPRRPSIGPLQLVDSDPSLSAELVDIFFKRCQPLPFMLHGPTFHYRRFLNQLSPILLDIIYAFAARLCENRSFLQTFSPHHPAHLRGELFAYRAHRSAEAFVHQRRGWSEETTRASWGTWQETELAQATLLLSVYFVCLREPELGAIYFDASLDILNPSSVAYVHPPASHPGAGSVEYATHLECRTRTFWALVYHDLCAASNGRPRRISEREIDFLPLPGIEAHWARWGGTDVGGREPGRRDGMVVGSGSWSGEEGSVVEIGNVIRISSILADIMSLATDPKSGDSKQTLASRLEASLKSWAMALPKHMYFNEPNLSMAVSKLASPVPETRASGWMYAYMHSVAECGMFYLQAAVAPVSDASVTARRQCQAIENLVVIMDAIGQSGREGCYFIFPLYVVSNWQEHLEKSELAVHDVKYHLTEERLNLWWAEMAREWGIDRHEVLRRGFYDLPSLPSALSPSNRQALSSEVPAPLGLGLYQSSPPGRAITEFGAALSPASTSGFSTPHLNHQHRFSLPSLHSLRPRAASGASIMSSHFGLSPSPPHHLPAMSMNLPDRGSDRDQERISLPSLRSELKFHEPPSPRHPLSQSISNRYTPKHHPYVRERPRSPPPLPDWSGKHRQEKSRVAEATDENKVTGIAALVNAAESERDNA